MGSGTRGLVPESRLGARPEVSVDHVLTLGVDHVTASL